MPTWNPEADDHGPRSDYLAAAESHLRNVIEKGTARYGPDPCPMWMSSLDIRTCEYPEDDSHPNGVRKRVYRSIDAPKGSTLYWDQPLVVAAHALSRITKDGRYSRAADAYVRAFLDRCVAKSGVFLWGNHYFWDVSRGAVVSFVSDEDPAPCDTATAQGELHEARPIPPAWETFWRVCPKATERCIRALGERHLFDKESGGFNRHADGRRAHAFLESGGILAESLCWLAKKTGDRSLLEAALRIANFSWRHRDPRTGLVRNNPTGGRWDALVCTTEVGLWAGSLIRASDLSGVEEFVLLAREAVAAYLRLGYDSEERRYFGMLQVRDGTPLAGERQTVHQPGEYADLWEPFFPQHDYPLALAETCASLYERTRAGEFEEAVRRWAEAIREETPARGGRGAYAEQYGRAIHFLLHGAEALGDETLRRQARRLAEEAGHVLLGDGMFRGHPGEERCDAVDGVGFLVLALAYLQTGVEPEGAGLGF